MKLTIKNLCAVSTALAMAITVGYPLIAQCGGYDSNASNGGASASQAWSPQQEAIKQVLQAYGKALNSADVNAVLAVYADDAVFMPDKMPTVAGRAALKAFYRQTFKKIKFHTQFTIDEISVFGDLAVVRTHHPKGSTLRINGVSKPDTNRELFIMKHVGGRWKIWRYMFNKNGKNTHS